MYSRNKFKTSVLSAQYPHYDGGFLKISYFLAPAGLCDAQAISSWGAQASRAGGFSCLGHRLRASGFSSGDLWAHKLSCSAARGSFPDQAWN